MIKISIAQQKLFLFDNTQCIKEYLVSTARNGAGEEKGSEKTPRGKHYIRAKIGERVSINTVFRGRRPTGEIYNLTLRKSFPERDWILTRIMWLCGLEPGKNRLGNVDTMRRYIYIHGTPDDVELGKPGSKGCIRMANADIVELFSIVPLKTLVVIE